MADINRQIIGKAIFAVSVVAATATIGVVGFAQAKQGTVLTALDDGYGGTSGQVQAAVDAFQEELAAARQQFQDDLDACLGTSSASASLRTSSNDALADLSANAASPSALNSETKLSSVLSASDAKLQAKLSADTAHLTGTLPISGQGACVREAAKDYRDAIKAAQAKFKAAIHDIFH